MTSALDVSSMMAWRNSTWFLSSLLLSSSLMLLFLFSAICYCYSNKLREGLHRAMQDRRDANFQSCSHRQPHIKVVISPLNVTNFLEERQIRLCNFEWHPWESAAQLGWLPDFSCILRGWCSCISSCCSLSGEVYKTNLLSLHFSLVVSPLHMF